MGKGKDPNAAAHEHVSTPLSTLKDPASFGPPPKRANYGQPAAAGSSRDAAAGGLGSQVTRQSRQQLQEEQAAQYREEEQSRPPPPPGSYQPDATGLSTAHLPRPPAKPKPQLPPRLPPRQNSHPDAYAQAPPPPYSAAAQESTATGGYLNQGALNRLGQAGVSVPGLNIGRNASPPVPPRQNSSPAPVSPPPPANNNAQLGELQSRFARMSTTSTSPASEAPSTGTTWAQKQAALNTATNLRNDPSKVSVADMRSAASTANNFRERHGEQVAAGVSTANRLNQKYGIAGKVNSFASGSASAAPAPAPAPALGKKAPPPPPPKKKELGGAAGEPPPIPLGSKPTF